MKFDPVRSVAVGQRNKRGLGSSRGPIITAAWLVFVAAIYGGLQAITFAPTVILSIVGTAMLVTATPLLWPESLSKDTSRDA